ncbi:MAG: response regulator [Verrucomicrobiota bacterium]|nr:response regulator [Verrucomicrobiota bacterium]
MNKKILVIDDEKLLRRVIVRTLKEEGYSTMETDDATQGLALAQRERPDLILCDVVMNHVDGYTALQTLRQNPSTAMIPVILMTGEANDEGWRKGMLLGADDYLEKPFSAQELNSVVAMQLQKQEVARKESEKTLEALRTNINFALPHELLTPLSGILGFSEMLREGNFSQADVKSMAESIHSSGQRLHDLINNYLIYAQIEVMATDRKQQEQLRLQRCRRAEAVIQSVALAEASRRKREGDVTLEFMKADLGISMEYLTRIVEELMRNACVFSSPGSPIHLRGCEHEGMYQIEFRDKGRGMSLEQINRIGAFLQFDRRVYEQQGMGLGLTICKRLAELHGGGLSISSAVGQGTSVRVLLHRAGN